MENSNKKNLLIVSSFCKHINFIYNIDMNKYNVAATKWKKIQQIGHT